jgi:hypothetical protein
MSDAALPVSLAKPAWRIQPRDWLAVGAVDAAAHSMNSLGPFVVGGLIEELHFSATRMGIWSMTEMLAYAFSMFVVAPRAGRLSLPALACGAAALAAFGQVLSAFLESYVLLVLLRIATGTGFGLLNTAVHVFAARAAHPDRAISFAMAMQTALFAAMGFALPKAGELGGRPGMFLALGAFVLVLIPFMLLQPSGAPERREVAGGGANPAALAATAALAADAHGDIAVHLRLAGDLAVYRADRFGGRHRSCRLRAPDQHQQCAGVCRLHRRRAAWRAFRPHGAGAGVPAGEWRGVLCPGCALGCAGFRYAFVANTCYGSSSIPL